MNDSPEHRRRGLLIAYATAGVLSVALVVAVVVVVTSGGDEGGGETQASFAPDYTDLAGRREAAGVSTMGAPEDASAHFHPRLEIYVDGNAVRVPINIGIDPTASPQEMASLHTHETDGTIHVEGMSNPTLGQFFDIWGVPFSRERLGTNEAGSWKAVRMWVDGHPSQAFGELALEDGQEIVVVYGSADATPPGLASER